MSSIHRELVFGITHQLKSPSGSNSSSSALSRRKTRGVAESSQKFCIMLCSCSVLCLYHWWNICCYYRIEFGTLYPQWYFALAFAFLVLLSIFPLNDASRNAAAASEIGLVASSNHLPHCQNWFHHFLDFFSGGGIRCTAVLHTISWLWICATLCGPAFRRLKFVLYGLDAQHKHLQYLH